MLFRPEFFMSFFSCISSSVTAGKMINLEIKRKEMVANWALKKKISLKESFLPKVSGRF